MITKEIFNKTKDFVYSQAEKHSAPSIFHIDLTNQKGQALAEVLGADKDVILMGTLLMDCMLGVAMKEGRVKDHIEMGESEAREFLSRFPELIGSERENILQCVKQHHGAEKFYSLEAEICCNADCYRFASVRGVIGGMRHSRPMPLEELVNLYSLKADEKWNVLSLEMCKKELEPQYRAIKEFLSKFNA